MKLAVEVPPLVCQDCYRRVVREFSKQIKVTICISRRCFFYFFPLASRYLLHLFIFGDYGQQVPGFRPGKTIPDNILVNYVGKQHVQRATIESILKRTLPHAMASVCQPNLENRILHCDVLLVVFYICHAFFMKEFRV